MSILRMENLSKHYGETKALQGVTLELEPGIYGLLGPNGAGKTTMIRILTSLLAPSGGQVTWDGRDIFSLGGTYRKQIGYMPQQQNLYPSLQVHVFMDYMAALKGMAKADRRSAIENLLDRVNLTAQINTKIGALSGGMKQRLLIAQALLAEPKLLILDEPTAGLDPAERVNLRALIAELASDRIVLLATHVVGDVEYIAKRVILMKAGRIVHYKDQAELLALTAVYETRTAPSVLQTLDPNLKVANMYPSDAGPWYRVISGVQLDERRVQATLDDVYLDWLA